MKKVCLFLLGACMVCAPREKDFMALIELDGWEKTGEIVFYEPETLYDYINGEAELYHSYGFQRLRTGTWTNPDDVSMVADVYDMGSPVNAFGLYSNYRYPDYNYEAIGTEAIVSEYDLRYFQDRYVVEIRASDASRETESAMRLLAKKISAVLPDTAGWPRLLQSLPAEGQTEKTLRYTARGTLNQSFFPEGLTASYEIDGEKVLAFMVFFPSLSSAESGWHQFSEFHAPVSDWNFGGQTRSFYADTPYHGILAAILQDSIITGIRGLHAPEQGLELMSKILERIQVSR
ncbi:MAG TPA: hypothetical protein ENN03_02205 [bacterium]|nr:hypothetical protein [bacterium]